MTSLFALKSLDDLQYWPELTSKEYSIFQLEVEEPLVELDAYFLNAGLSQSVQNENFYQAFLPDENWDKALNYWSGKFSGNPKPELLIPFLVKVLDKLEK